MKRECRYCNFKENGDIPPLGSERKSIIAKYGNFGGRPIEVEYFIEEGQAFIYLNIADSYIGKRIPAAKYCPVCGRKVVKKERENNGDIS